jgi:hypothetical protein
MELFMHIRMYNPLFADKHVRSEVCNDVGPDDSNCIYISTCTALFIDLWTCIQSHFPIYKPMPLSIYLCRKLPISIPLSLFIYIYMYACGGVSTYRFTFIRISACPYVVTSDCWYKGMYLCTFLRKAGSLWQSVVVSGSA